MEIFASAITSKWIIRLWLASPSGSINPPQVEFSLDCRNWLKAPHCRVPLLLLWASWNHIHQLTAIATPSLVLIARRCLLVLPNPNFGLILCFKSTPGCSSHISTLSDIDHIRPRTEMELSNLTHLSLSFQTITRLVSPSINRPCEYCSLDCQFGRHLFVTPGSLPVSFELPQARASFMLGKALLSLPLLSCSLPSSKCGIIAPVYFLVA